MTIVSYEPKELIESTGYLLARLGAESRRTFVEALARKELTLTAYSVMMLLGVEQGASQRRLGKVLGIDPRNLVATLDDLEDRRFITREHHMYDRRRNAVMLTDYGQAQMLKLGRLGQEVEDEFLKPLSARQRKQLHLLLKTLLTRHISLQ